MTDFDLLPGAIHRGLGFVARWSEVVLVIPNHPSHDNAVRALFDELGTEPDPAFVVQQVNDLIVESATLQAAAYLLTETGGPLVMVYGNMEVLVDGDLLIGKTDQPVESQISTGERITIRAANLSKAAEPAPPFDLRRGIVPGGGITIGGVTMLSKSAPLVPPPPEQQVADPGGATPASAPAQPTRPTAPFESVRLQPEAGLSQREPLAIIGRSEPVDPTGPRPADVAPRIPEPGPVALSSHTVAAPTEPARREPAPGEAQGGAPAAQDGEVMVQGIVCSRGHFNNPAAAFCMVCGISMVHVTHNLVPGPRPTLGFIVFDDGSTFGLDRSYVVGREPGGVDDGNTAPLAIQDNNETLSRRHAEVRLVDWEVHIVDLNSTNGSFIWDTDYQRWNQISPGHPIPLKPGDTVALGRRTFVYESVSGS